MIDHIAPSLKAILTEDGGHFVRSRGIRLRIAFTRFYASHRAHISESLTNAGSLIKRRNVPLPSFLAVSKPTLGGGGMVLGEDAGIANKIHEKGLLAVSSDAKDALTKKIYRAG